MSFHRNFNTTTEIAMAVTDLRIEILLGSKMNFGNLCLTRDVYELHKRYFLPV